MDDTLRRELSSCIQELYRISDALDEAAAEVRGSITGMNTRPYTKALNDCASRYRSAARNLSRIH